MLGFDNFEIGNDLNDLLPRGGRFVMAFIYTVWGFVSLAFIGTGFFQHSTFLTTIHIATGSLFLLAMLFFLAINVMTSGNPGCVLLFVQNGIAMLLGLLGVLLFIFGHSIEQLLR